MGEAKRRKKLDPSYGQLKAKILLDVQQMIYSSPLVQEMAINQLLEDENFWLQKTDILYEPVVASEEKRFYWTTSPTDSRKNKNRSYFIKHEKIVRDAISPLIGKFGAGWIIQLEQPEIDKTHFNYVPATQENLEKLAQDQFCGSMGQTIRFIIETAMFRWDWGKCVPVIATTVRDEDPVWIYIV
ncbi:hypothetical protein Cylst_6391 (plasmid) [Cylindrospermum stagnale PCC 7417]|uniref:Uncharacterized protein n=1 Tax=Cylindrospermum stagnale PCC 7417 TaxID=56107 RepID=K9X939_9NOST|nr:hypothetical protein [Cylindrospermum stagnale]AFZ28609.1 hypothetical protein Cylst_6391 [Cylindrospermum stagnale PCC 7417]